MSNKKISDEAVVDAAMLLRKGAKMLSYFCPECHFPLFEAEDKIFCPNCEKEVIIEKEEKKEVVERKIEIPNKDIANSIEKAFCRICDMIISSNSVEEIKILSDSLEKVANVLEKIKKL
ncbi:MAG: Sjogren's syndrome/scleroderma autoantigen 1 family protein [Archaeoglobaceae archaeon]